MASLFRAFFQFFIELIINESYDMKVEMYDMKVDFSLI